MLGLDGAAKVFSSVACACCVSGWCRLLSRGKTRVPVADSVMHTVCLAVAFFLRVLRGLAGSRAASARMADFQIARNRTRFRKTEADGRLDS